MADVVSATIKITAGKWVRFEPGEARPKTKTWKVIANQGDILLGTVSWLGRWRCYAFSPTANTVFEEDCLRDIAAFIEEQTKAHKGK